jgi:hypothetical protein
MAGNQANTITCVLKCMMCLVACFERFIRFVNRHAYVEVIMNCEGFCPSAKKAIALIMNNVVRFGVLNGLVELIMMFGTFLISILVTMIGYYCLQMVTWITEDVFETYAPLLMIFLISYACASIFMHVYDCSADVILHCFILDENLNSGVAKNAPEKMRKVVNDHGGSHQRLSDNQR